MVNRIDPVDALAWEARALGLVDPRSRERGSDPAPDLRLRIWESAHPCVVLPRNGRASDWAHLEACRSLKVPVLRRQSGGGAVVLGPGCLSFSLILSLEARPALMDVAWSYRWLLGRLARALAPSQLAVGGTDLLLGDRKCAGHAQRRTRVRLLHHGTILYDFDLRLIDELLPEPPRRPRHRGRRTHREFLVNLGVTREQICERMARLPALVGPTARWRGAPTPSPRRT